MFLRAISRYFELFLLIMLIFRRKNAGCVETCTFALVLFYGYV